MMNNRGLHTGCEAAALSDNLHTLAVEFAEEKANQTAFWVWALSAAGGTPSCPDMDLGGPFFLQVSTSLNEDV